MTNPDQNVANQARSAFDSVGIFQGEQAGSGEDIATNQGNDYLLVSTPNSEALVLVDLTANEILLNPLSSTDFISRPSITDDGSVIVFIDSDCLHF